MESPILAVATIAVPRWPARKKAREMATRAPAETQWVQYSGKLELCPILPIPQQLCLALLLRCLLVRFAGGGVALSDEGAV